MGIIEKILIKIIGTRNERELKKLRPILEHVNSLEPKVRELSDDELRRKTGEFKERLSNGATLDDILPEAFAVVREVARRKLNMRHFDVQIIGGIVLHQGKIAEMKTGEGKTLVATLPAYLNALEGKGVHIVTVNDYLAKRDAEWMGVIYKFLGLEVGVIVPGLDDLQRKKAYNADITYGVNSEFGFDYLRDNMKYSLEDMVQRGFNYAIVDEVDSILIDEARTPLIISGPAEESPEIYYRVNSIVKYLEKDRHFTVDEKMKTVILTEEGIAKAESLLNVDNLYDPKNIDILHALHQALRAHHLFHRDVDYVVKDGKVIIVDEFTGRLLPGRRWSDGLHQAIEAKEGVRIESENQTLATITYQNFFRMYKKLAGMTGTAETEALEFKKIYNLDVVVIPTNKPLIRIEYPDVVFKTEREKFKAVVDEIEELHKIGRPVLVGTISIEKSEKLSQMLKRRGIPHNVLNAKHHEKEAMIIAQAGRKGAVTIATNMAGRGVDILLGGNPEYLAKQKAGPNATPEEIEKYYREFKEICDKEHEEVVKLGGLHVIGTERHEARRIDNQLRGRAGRQGDPGSSRFYLSLEDDLLRIFGSDRLKSLMERVGMKEGERIEHKWVTKAIENAQKRVEAHNFEIRKHLLEYDNVMNKQREVIYGLRREILSKENIKEEILEIAEEIAEGLVDAYLPEDQRPSEWDWKGFVESVRRFFSFHFKMENEKLEVKREEVLEELKKNIRDFYTAKEIEYGSEVMRKLERFIYLTTIDSLWKDHLLTMDHLREGIGLRGYAQRDPLVEYKKEAFALFEDLLGRIKENVIQRIFWVRLAKERREPISLPRRVLQFNRPSVPTATITRDKKKVGRNDPCPCGSGKKYKKCCGRTA